MKLMIQHVIKARQRLKEVALKKGNLSMHDLTVLCAFWDFRTLNASEVAGELRVSPGGLNSESLRYLVTLRYLERVEKNSFRITSRGVNLLSEIAPYK